MFDAYEWHLMSNKDAERWIFQHKKRFFIV